MPSSRWCITGLLIFSVCLLQVSLASSGVAKVDKPEDTVDVAAAPLAKNEALPAPLDQEDSVGEARVQEGKEKTEKVDISFYHAFMASFSVIIVSELGDKTWFIAVILSMRHSRIAVFSGAIGALALMTVLSACLGWVTQLIPRAVTYYVSTALFAIFGLKMLHEGWHMSASEGQDIMEESQAEVQKRELSMDADRFDSMEAGGAGINSLASISRNRRGNSATAIVSFVSKIFLEAFTLTFLAEWGDRSQLTTIILGAREDIAGVIIGGVLGHAICTGIAVVGGKLVATRISVRTVTLVGGVVFIIFALSAFFINDVDQQPVQLK